MNKKIPQFQPYLNNLEYEAIKDCFDSNWITEGPKSKEFIERLCKLIGVKHAVLSSNGTLSLYMGLKAIGIEPGDEVIVPNFTFIASANAVNMCGAKPVFVDIKDDLHIDLEKCEQALTKKTKAIMPVHIYGMACNMDKVSDFAKKHNIKVIEDAAQAIGIKWSNRHAGTFGDVGSFSFFADKTITTGEGGMVVTNDEEIYNKLLYIRNQGRLDRGSFIHPEIGYNFRMTDIQSAIGLAQLTKLDDIIKKKQGILETYKALLDDRYTIITPPKESNHIPFRVCITIPGGSSKLMHHMSQNNIETRTFFYPLHKQPCFKNIVDCSNQTFEVSERMYEEGVCLPSFVDISSEEIEYVCKKVNEYV